METIKPTLYVSVTEHNALLEQGYKYFVEGDWKMLDQIDPWSGMPEVSGNTHYFTTLEEAQEYAQTQRWIFNPDRHANVREMAHRETRAERQAREQAEEAQREAARLERDKKQAAKKGMALEEFERLRALKKEASSCRSSAKKATEALAEAERAKKQAEQWLAEEQNRLRELEAEIAKLEKRG